jgi:hypothetical protein
VLDIAGQSGLSNHAILAVCSLDSVTIVLQESIAAAHSISLALASKSSGKSEAVASGIASEAGRAARESVASVGSNVSGTLASSERHPHLQQQQQQQQQQQRVESGPSIFKPRTNTKLVSKTP